MESPVEVPDANDPGDDTQRRFRYQHAYGVILACGCIRNSLPYIAIYCEQYEDLLGEHPDGTFDAYQIKTRNPELSPWLTSDEAFVKSIARFCSLITRFGPMFKKFVFCSNVECLDSEAANRKKKSPVRLIEAIRTSVDLASLDADFTESLRELATNAEKTTAEVYALFKKLELVVGPGLNDFNAVVSHTHLSVLPQCAALSAGQLDSVRDHLMQLVFQASAIPEEAAQHWSSRGANGSHNPWITPKRLPIEQFKEEIESRIKRPFRFYPVQSSLALGTYSGKNAILAKKLAAGGLGSYFETFNSRGLSAETRLLELVARDSEAAAADVSQIEAFVKTRCDDARNDASQGSLPFGSRMYSRLKATLEADIGRSPEIACHEGVDCLLGVASLLTGDCRVWWSEEFSLNGESA